MGGKSSKAKSTSATSPALGSHSAGRFHATTTTSGTIGGSSSKAASTLATSPALGSHSAGRSHATTTTSGRSSFSNQPATSQTSHGSTASNIQRLQTSTSFIKPIHVPARSCRPAGQSVTYSVNNYVIPKAQQSEKQEPGCITLPCRSLPDKFGLRVCPQYNSKGGCHASLCRRFHVCRYWVMKKCHKETCEYDHSHLSVHNDIIMSVISKWRDFNINKICQTLQSNQRQKKKTQKEEDACICVYNIMKKCSKKPCSLVHNNKPFQWEVRDCVWIQFSYQQSNYLELLYSHPALEIIELPQLPLRLRHHRGLQKLGSLLSQAESWNVNLENMTLYSGKLSFYIRRLSTPSDITCDFNLATRWIWYWQDDNGSWQPYTDGIVQYFVIALSDQLEHNLQFEQNRHYIVKVGEHSYDINIYDKTQRNLETGKIIKVRRRPVSRMLEHEELSFDRLFLAPSNKEFMLHQVLPITSEFTYIKKMVAESLFNVSISSIHRIQNDYLWKTYQNKKYQLLAVYCNDTSMVNEQYLFHGTKHSVIDKICCESFDWRLFGSNVGNVYGQGTYFSNEATLADRYSDTNALGQKAMFVTFVLVGTMTVGRSSMEFPPKNPKTGRSFDTTCNDDFKSTIFVKYNIDEYYPAYIIKYSCG